MQTKMTERDKKLLFALVIIVIVFVIGYLGIYPLIKSTREINKEIEEQEALQSENELKLTNLPMLQVDNEKMEEGILEKRKDFYPVMTASDIDKLLTGNALSYNLYSYDLDIDVVDTVVDLVPYQYSEKAGNGSSGADGSSTGSSSGTSSGSGSSSVSSGSSVSGNGAGMSETDQIEAADAAQYGDDSSTGSTGSTGSSGSLAYGSGDEVADMSAVGIYVAYVSMRLGGDQADLASFLDDMVASGEKVRVVSYSWTEGRKIDYNNDGTYNLVTEKVLDISLELYMSDPGDEVEDSSEAE